MCGQSNQLGTVIKIEMRQSAADHLSIVEMMRYGASSTTIRLLRSTAKWWASPLNGNRRPVSEKLTLLTLL